MPVCEFADCGLPFVKAAGAKAQRFCKRPECVAARHRKTLADFAERQRQAYAHKLPAHSKRTIKKCAIFGTKHNNYFDKCNTCRKRILDSYDVSMMV